MENQTEISYLCQALQRSIKKRFAFILDSSANNFDPIYALSTYMHPQLLATLPENLLGAARAELRKLVKFNNFC